MGRNALIDYLTIVLPMASADARGLSDLNHLLSTIFGTHRDLTVTALREKRWQFYQLSSVIVDRDGQLVGRVGVGGNGQTICISLSGAGTKWVTNWHAAHAHLSALGAKISRVDLAYDDYDGALFNVHHLRARALAGDFKDATAGRPPDTRFLSDEGSGKGSTLYVGGKGHKEACFYEKGKMQGFIESLWVRAEVRLYAKHVVVPLDVLLDPADYLRGSYSLLAEMLVGVCTRLKTTARYVQATGIAMVRWAHRQVGRTLTVLREAFGDSWPDFVEANIMREGRPARFDGMCPGDQLATHLRIELCPTSS
ncbi:MAG: replication initiation factor domain-containing protein [Lysobacteraceae bacterium]